jgi:hypothetical protein
VLASDLAPLAETMGAGGCIVPAERDAWIAAVRALPEAGAALGAAGRAQLGTRYSETSAAAAYEALYDDVGRPHSNMGRTF